MLNKLLVFKKHQGFLRYFKNTSWMMVERFLRILAGLFVGIWVARYLGPEQFGIFSYVLAFTTIFAGIAKLGLSGIIVRELIKHPEKRDVYLGTAFWLKMIGALFVMGLMAVILPFTSNDEITNAFIFIIIAGCLFQSFEVVEFYFQSQVLAKIVSVCKVSQLSVSSCIKIYLVLTQAELIWFIWVTTFDAFSLALSYFVAYRISKNPPFYKYFDLDVGKAMLKDSWPLIFSSIVVMIYMRVDQIMIKEMFGTYEVGVYSAAVRLSEAFYFLPMLITTSLFPAILNAKIQSDELYKKRLQRLYNFMVWCAIAIALPMTFLSEWITILLYGADYKDSAGILVIHVWASVFVFLGVSFGKYLLAENLARITFQKTILGVTCNICLNLWLIPLYGGLGAAVATLLSQFMANIGYDIFDKRLHQQLLMKIKAFFVPWKV